DDNDGLRKLPVLNRPQRVENLDLPGPSPRADNLPDAQVGRFAQNPAGLVQQHGQSEPKAAPSDDFLAEQCNGPGFSAEGLAQCFGLWLEQSIQPVGPIGQRSANP